MQNNDLIKLAPTLSAEERYKILIPDFHRKLMGEKCLISESELQAMTKFDNRAVWEEYTQKICILQWATMLWQKDIEAERLRVLACYLLLNQALQNVLWNDDKSISKEKEAEQFEKLKEHVAMIEELFIDFYAYKEAINKIEQELYGVPLFDDKKKKLIVAHYEMADGLIEHYNGTIHNICENGFIKKCFKPITRDVESYLVKKPTPDAKLIEQIIGEIRQIAESEMRMLGR